MTDFGRDLSCRDDLDPLMREVEGVEAVTEAAHRRLSTPRGQLIDDPDYGLDVLEALSGDLTAGELAQLPAEIDRELVKDERIQASTTEFGSSPTTGALSLAIIGETSLGPFELTREVSTVTAALLAGARNAGA